MSKMKSFLEDVQILLEEGYNIMDIAEALYIDYETAESAVEYWTDCIEQNFIVVPFVVAYK